MDMTECFRKLPPVRRQWKSDSTELQPVVVTKRKPPIFDPPPKELPEDYDSWSSTVIFFRESKDDHIGVYAVNSDNCDVYHVVSYQLHAHLCNQIGYAVGDFKVFFAGYATVADHYYNFKPAPRTYSHEIQVYDLLKRQWVSQDFPKLTTPKPTPFVFYHDGRLHVLSTRTPHHPFETLDIHNLSKGWALQPNPPFLSIATNPHFNPTIFDYSAKMLWFRVPVVSGSSDYSTDLYGWSFRDNEWHMPNKGSASVPRYLLVNPWSGTSVMVGVFLFTFVLLDQHDCPPQETRPVLIIRDLSHFRKDAIWEVDLSQVVHHDVIPSDILVGYLAYLAKTSNAGLRFSLLICFHCGACAASHRCACTFDLISKEDSSTLSFSAKPVACQYNHWEKGFAYSSTKLCKVTDV